MLPSGAPTTPRKRAERPNRDEATAREPSRRQQSPRPRAAMSPPMPRHWQVRPDAVALVRGALAAAAEGRNGCGGGATAQVMAAKERRRRVSDKTAELSRLIPGASRLNSTAEKLRAAALHVMLLQAQVGILALLPPSATAGEQQQQEKEEKNALQSMAMAAEEKRTMRALLASGGVQERLAGEGKCLVPTSLVGAVAGDESSNPILNRDLNRFIDSLQKKPH